MITEQFVDDGRWCTSCGSYEVMTVEMVDGWNDDCSRDCVIDNSSSSGYIDRQCVDDNGDNIDSVLMVFVDDGQIEGFGKRR